MSAIIHRPSAFDGKQTLDHDKKDSNGNEPPKMPPSDYVTHSEFKEFRVEIGDKFAKVDERLGRLESDVSIIKATMATKDDIAEVRADIHKGIVETQRWMIATVIGLFVGFGGLFLAMSNALKPQQAQPQAAPIVIQIPSSTLAPVPPAVK